VDDPPCDVFRTERGGEVTYHGPGQLVAYPILNLVHHKKDLRWYLQSLEDVVINTCATFGVVAERREGLTGVWASGAKIAAIGIAASRWITLHGFALNVCTDLSAFEKIVPCGLTDGVTSLAQLNPNGRCPCWAWRTCLVLNVPRQYGCSTYGQQCSGI